MATTNNNIRSKVMKAAWKIYRKSYKVKSMSNWSKALKRAWAWAKETLTQAFNIWMPKTDFGRVYFGKNYMQFTLRNKAAKSMYEKHRAAKGEVTKVAYYKLVGIELSQVSSFFEEIGNRISVHNVEFTPSKF